MAVTPSSSRHQLASTGSPSGPWTRSGRRRPPSTAAKPSPPSDTGAASADQPWATGAPAMASATCSARWRSPPLVRCGNDAGHHRQCCRRRARWPAGLVGPGWGRRRSGGRLTGRYCHPEYGRRHTISWCSRTGARSASAVRPTGRWRPVAGAGAWSSPSGPGSSADAALWVAAGVGPDDLEAAAAGPFRRGGVPGPAGHGRAGRLPGLLRRHRQPDTVVLPARAVGPTPPALGSTGTGGPPGAGSGRSTSSSRRGRGGSGGPGGDRAGAGLPTGAGPRPAGGRAGRTCARVAFLHTPWCSPQELATLPDAGGVGAAGRLGGRWGMRVPFGPVGPSLRGVLRGAPRPEAPGHSCRPPPPTSRTCGRSRPRRRASGSWTS